VNDTTVFSTVDLLPTFCRLAGVEVPRDLTAQLDGEDLSAAFTGAAPLRAKPLFWEYGRNTNAFAYPRNPVDRSPNVAVRDGDWKLLVNADGSGPELYDLATDAKETKNLAVEKAQVVQRLKEIALRWRKSMP
jgi:arylsulfatase A-like enzyme